MLRDERHGDGRVSGVAGPRCALLAAVGTAAGTVAGKVGRTCCGGLVSARRRLVQRWLLSLATWVALARRRPGASFAARQQRRLA